MVGDYDLRKGLVTSENDVASILTLEAKSYFQERGDARAP